MIPQFVISHRERRLFEMIPGIITWSIILTPFLCIFFAPTLVVITLLLFHVYWFFRSCNISIHLIIAYFQIRKAIKFDWWKYLQTESDLWKPFIHLVMIPAYNEDYLILQQNIQALSRSQYDLKKIWVVLAIEERGGEAIQQSAKKLAHEFGAIFYRFDIYIHPDGIEGEVKGKGANITYAASQLETLIDQEKISRDTLLVTSIDSDGCVHPQLFAHFTAIFLKTPFHHQRLFQFLPMYHNNFWSAPAFSRQVAMGSAFWAMVESTRVARFRTFACYGMSWTNLQASEYWDKTSIIEDGVQYWRNIFAWQNEAKTVVPVYSPVYLDAVKSDTFLTTMIAQYKQLRRWSWGASDLALIMPFFLRIQTLSLKEKTLHVARLLESHISWSTVAFILLVSGYIPLLNNDFSQTVLGYQTPIIFSWLVRCSLLSLSFSIIISTMLLPDDIRQLQGWQKWKKHLQHILGWGILPFVAILFGALPALHSQTELMFGKKMESFVVTEKKR